MEQAKGTGSRWLVQGGRAESGGVERICGCTSQMVTSIPLGALRCQEH